MAGQGLRVGLRFTWASAAGLLRWATAVVLIALVVPAPALAQHYFVEFRARAAEPIGHTFIVYGRTDARGRVIERHHAGLSPKGDVWRALLSPVPGAVQPVHDDRAQPTQAIYRRWLSAVEFRRLIVTLRRLQARHHRWHPIVFNCNDFAIEVADTLGLRRMPSLMPPVVWVESLRVLNGG